MGYHTDFSGSIKVEPPLNAEEVAYLMKFAETRRMSRRNGPYFVDGGGFKGQVAADDVIDYNRPAQGQPGMWCQWVPTLDGTAIEWDGGEKFYDSTEWMQYLIDHFLRPGAAAKSALPFLQANHVCNGLIDAQGEETTDSWQLIVTDNKVTTKALR